MNGSILFNPDINVEVDVDPSAEEGARLVSAKNLVDGQELGIGGGSELPEVTPADEGKVLAVNASGEWAAESAYFIINDNEGTLDKTAGEIKAALENNMICVICYTGETLMARWPVAQFENEEGTYRIVALGNDYNPIYQAAGLDAYPVFVD